MLPCARPPPGRFVSYTIQGRLADSFLSWADGGGRTVAGEQAEVTAAEKALFSATTPAGEAAARKRTKAQRLALPQHRRPEGIRVTAVRLFVDVATLALVRCRAKRLFPAAGAGGRGGGVSCSGCRNERWVFSLAPSVEVLRIG